MRVLWSVDANVLGLMEQIGFGSGEFSRRWPMEEGWNGGYGTVGFGKEFRYWFLDDDLGATFWWGRYTNDFVLAFGKSEVVKDGDEWKWVKVPSKIEIERLAQRTKDWSKKWQASPMPCDDVDLHQMVWRWWRSEEVWTRLDKYLTLEDLGLLYDAWKPKLPCRIEGLSAKYVWGSIFKTLVPPGKVPHTVRIELWETFGHRIRTVCG